MAGHRSNNNKRLRTQDDCGDNERSKRRNSHEEIAPISDGDNHTTVYRYLCPGRKVGGIIGRGGEIVRKLMAETEAKIAIDNGTPGCEERVITISSTTGEMDASEDTSDHVCPAQTALFKVHERVAGNETTSDGELSAGEEEVSLQLLVPHDQIGHIIGRNGQTIHCIRNDSEAYIQIQKGDCLPTCAKSTDELVEITGESPSVRKALLQISTLLHRNPSHLQNFSSEISLAHSQGETVYRYLCPERSIGSIIGKGGEIVKQLRADTQAKITIGERVSGCKERVVTILSYSDKTRAFGSTGDYICPAQDALLRLHERIIANDSPADEDVDAGGSTATLRLVVPPDQVGHVIGKSGHMIQEIRNSTGATIQILKDEHLPSGTNTGDEVIQITGEVPKVMKALVQVSSCLHDRPSQYYPIDSYSHLQNGNSAGGCFAFHQELGESSSKAFVLYLLCPTANIGRVIGKDGNRIDEIRKQSGAFIKVDSSTAEEDCIISISERESSGDPICSTIYAAVRLQPSCSEMTKRERGQALYTTRLLVPASQIGHLIGKGGSVIMEIRRATQANIRIMTEGKYLPKVATEDDVLVQISGELDATRKALTQVVSRLKTKFFV